MFDEIEQKKDANYCLISSKSYLLQLLDDLKKK